MSIIDRDYLVTYLKSASSLLDYSNNDEDAISEAINTATADALAALRRKGLYSEVALTSLTPEISPVDLKRRTAAKAIDHLTSADAGRPENITTAAAEAKQWFSWVATGNVVVDGIERKRRGGVRGGSPDKLIFHDDDCD